MTGAKGFVVRLRILPVLFLSLCLFAFRAQAAVTEPPVGGGGSCPGAIAWDGSQGQQKAFNNGLYTCSGGAWTQEAFIVGSMLQDGTSPACNSAHAGMIKWTGTAFQGCDGSSWSTLGSGGGAAFSGLTGATATNSIDNSAYAQTWAWNSLTTQTGLTVSSGSLTTGSLLALANTSTAESGYVLNALSATTSSGYGIYSALTGHGNTGYAGYFANTDTGADANYALYATTSSTGAGVGVYAAITGSGNTGAAVEALNSSTSGWGIYAGGTSPNYFNGAVGIGTTAPATGAVLDMGTNTSSARLPVGTTGQEPDLFHRAQRSHSLQLHHQPVRRLRRHQLDNHRFKRRARLHRTERVQLHQRHQRDAEYGLHQQHHHPRRVQRRHERIRLRRGHGANQHQRRRLDDQRFDHRWPNSRGAPHQQRQRQHDAERRRRHRQHDWYDMDGDDFGRPNADFRHIGYLYRQFRRLVGGGYGLPDRRRRPWLRRHMAGAFSTSTVNARGRVDISYPVVRAIDGTTVVAGANLWGGALANAVTASGGSTYTGSYSSGSAAATCSDWTTTGGSGERGSNNSTSSTWIDNGSVSCSSSYNLYCINQISTTCSAEAFSFASLAVQPLSTLVTSDTLTPTQSCASGTTAPVSVSGPGSPQISINGGAWASSGTMNPGDTLQVRQTTSASNSTTQTDTITIGNTTGTWAVTTQAAGTEIFRTTGSYTGNLGGLTAADADCQTEASSLGYGGTWRALLSTSTVNARGRIDISYPVVRAADGTTTVAAASLWGSLANAVSASANTVWTGSNLSGTYSGQTCTNWTTTAGNGEFGTGNATTAGWIDTSSQTCGNNRNLYCLSQLSTNCSAEAFSFTDQTGAPLSTLTTSNTITPTPSCASGTTSSVSVSGSGSPQISIAGGTWGTSGTMNPGDTLQVRLTSSASYSTALTATVTIGSTTSNWSVTTAGDCTSSPAVGTVCLDGTVYAGLTVGGTPMYAARCDVGQTWNGAACTGARTTIPWNNGNSTGYTTTSVTNNNDGKTNTASLVTIDSDSGVAGTQPHQAAAYCHADSEDGYSDWYLPAANELNTLYGNHAAIGNFDTSGIYYWSSTESNNTTAWDQKFDNGASNVYNNKSTAYYVRCVRHN